MAGIMGAVILFRGCTADGILQRLQEPYKALSHSPQFTDGDVAPMIKVNAQPGSRAPECCSMKLEPWHTLVRVFLFFYLVMDLKRFDQVRFLVHAST